MKACPKDGLNVQVSYNEVFLKKLVVQLEEYLSRKPNDLYPSIDEMCRSNATEILERAKFLL